MEDIRSFTTLISEKLVRWVEAFVKILPNILLAAVIITAGFYLARGLKNLAKKLLTKVSHNPALTNLFTSMIHIFLLSIVLFTALSVLQLDKAVTSILAGAGIIGLALAFAFQDIASNFISGIFIIIRKPLKVGDSVNISKYSGDVMEINLRDTVIKTSQGVLVTIPNKEVFQNPIENVNELERRRYDLRIGVSYAEDLERVKQVTLDAIKEIEHISEKFPTRFYYREFGESSINFDLFFWVELGPGVLYLEVGSQVIQQIKLAFDREGISIPYPVRTMDFGIKGGVSLADIPIKSADPEPENLQETASIKSQQKLPKTEETSNQQNDEASDS